MINQTTIETEAAINKCERGMDADWAERALEVVERICKDRFHFTADDIWYHIDPPREPSALGVVLRRAAKLGWCVCTDEYRQSIRPSTHKRPLRVWQSRIQ